MVDLKMGKPVDSWSGIGLLNMWQIYSDTRWNVLRQMLHILVRSASFWKCMIQVDRIQVCSFQGTVYYVLNFKGTLNIVLVPFQFCKITLEREKIFCFGTQCLASSKTFLCNLRSKIKWCYCLLGKFHNIARFGKWFIFQTNSILSSHYLFYFFNLFFFKLQLILSQQGRMNRQICFWVTVSLQAILQGTIQKQLPHSKEFRR